MKAIHVIWILLVPALLYAQTGIDLKSSSGYTGNAFNNYHQSSDYYTWVNGNIKHDWSNDNEGLRLYYEGSAILYNQYKDKNYLDHKLGVSFYRYLDKAGNRLNAGLNFGQRQHSDAYRWFEMSTAEFFASLKLILSPQWYAYVGLDLSIEKYKILGPFSNSQSQLYIRISKFFNSGTTIIAETDLFGKYYQSWNSTSTVENFPNIVTTGDNNSQQIQAVLRAAQAVSPKTGLSGQILFRHNLSNTTRYLGTDSGYYYSDEEIFNDPFGYHSAEYDIKLKQLLPWKSTLSIGASLKERDYQDRLAMDLEGNPYEDYRNRKDERYSLWFSLQKKTRLGSSMKPLTLSLAFTHLVNQSNDLYYDYQSQYFSLSLDQSF